MTLSALKNRPTLGIVAISHNEERDMGEFLNHLLPWVDEIVIVDDGSNDRTADLARAGGAKVKFIESPRSSGQYYSHQRNKGIEAASSAWLLHMDIDERVTPELRREILTCLQDSAKDGYRFRRLNFFLHRQMRGGGWQDWNLVHLARRDKFRFGGKVHETCLLDAPASRVGQLSSYMWHLNDSDYSERLRKSMTYCSVEAEDLLQAGRKVTWAQLLLRPLASFIKTYFFRSGFRDGVAGLISSIHSADAKFRAIALAWDQQNRISRETLEMSLTASSPRPEPKASQGRLVTEIGLAP
jgi:glycosyltransferase involved in cell wall biosynthesis